MYPKVHSTINYNSQDMEATWVSFNRWVDKKDVLHIFTVEYHWAIKKNEILPFATAWMSLDGTMLVK